MRNTWSVLYSYFDPIKRQFVNVAEDASNEELAKVEGLAIRVNNKKEIDDAISFLHQQTGREPIAQEVERFNPTRGRMEQFTMVRVNLVTRGISKLPDVIAAKFKPVTAIQ